MNSEASRKANDFLCAYFDSTEFKYVPNNSESYAAKNGFIAGWQARDTLAQQEIAQATGPLLAKIAELQQDEKEGQKTFNEQNTALAKEIFENKTLRELLDEAYDMISSVPRTHPTVTTWLIRAAEALKKHEVPLPVNVQKTEDIPYGDGYGSGE